MRDLNSKLRPVLLASLLLMGHSIAEAQQTVTIGTGTTATNSYGPARITTAASSSMSSKVINLYTPSDLAAAGIYPGSVINAIGWQKHTNGILSNGASVTINVALRSGVTGTSYGTGVTSTTLIDNYVGTNFPVTNGSKTYNTTSNFPADTTWELITLTNPFTYTGGGLEVYTNSPFTAGTGNPATANITWRINPSSPANTTLCMYTNSLAAYNSTSPVNIGGIRPNTRITFTPPSACTGTPNAGVLSFDTLQFCPGVIRGNFSLTGAGFAPGVNYTWQKRQGTQAAFATIPGTNYFNLYNETANDTVSYRVIVHCVNGGADTSNIITLIPATDYIPNYMETFTTSATWLASAMPDCWYGRKGFLDNPVVMLQNAQGYTVGSWSSDGWRNNGTTGAARAKPYGAGGRVYDWLITPAVKLDTAAWQLEFDLGLFANNATTAGTFDADDQLSIIISTDGGQTWTIGANNEYILRTYTSADNLSDSSHIIIPLTGFSGNRIAIGFHLDGGLTQPASTALIPDVMIDNVQIVPLCITPMPGSIAGDTLICRNNPVSYTSTTAAGIDSLIWIVPQGWSSVSTGQQATITPGNSSGWIHVVGYSTVCAASDTQSLYVHVSPAPEISAPTYTICEGDALTLTSTAASSYTWFHNGNNIPNAHTDTVSVSAAGDYTVVTTNNGCTDTSVAVTLVVNPAPQPIIQNNNNTLSTTQPYAGYQWIKNNQDISGATNATYVVTDAAIYAVRVTDMNGCMGISDTMTVDDPVSATNIQEHSKSIRVYPNPASDILQIESSSGLQGLLHISITDVTGRILKVYNMKAGGVQSVSIDPLKAGVYFINIANGKNRYATRFIKN